MADKAFRIQVLETIAALMTAAFGLVAALAWNQAIAWAVQQVFSKPADQGTGYFVYAILVTILAVIATILIGRVLARMKTAAGEEKK
ncbi:MAG TPA: DUF5654 family protein [Methanomassiliicoccales archaeon]|nr:DUF5654 family protein [Methanomassiliicoccales archaeon]